MCLPTHWNNIRLNYSSVNTIPQNTTEIASLASSTSETLIDSFQDTTSLSESDRTQVDNRTIWDIPLPIWDIPVPNYIRITDQNVVLENVPEIPQGPNGVRHSR